VWFGGRRVDTMGEKERSALRRERFGFVFQFGQLVPELTAEENVALPLLLDGTRRAAATGPRSPRAAGHSAAARARPVLCLTGAGPAAAHGSRRAARGPVPGAADRHDWPGGIARPRFPAGHRRRQRGMRAGRERRGRAERAAAPVQLAAARRRPAGTAAPGGRAGKRRPAADRGRGVGRDRAAGRPAVPGIAAWLLTAAAGRRVLRPRPGRARRGPRHHRVHAPPAQAHHRGPGPCRIRGDFSAAAAEKSPRITGDLRGTTASPRDRRRPRGGPGRCR